MIKEEEDQALNEGNSPMINTFQKDAVGKKGEVAKTEEADLIEEARDNQKRAGSMVTNLPRV